MALARLAVSVAVMLVMSRAAVAQVNAADHYRRAFDLCDRLLTREARAALFPDDGPPDVRLPAVVDALRRTTPILDALRAGATVERCDWGVDYSRGVDAELPSLSRTRELAVLAIEHARSRASDGDHGSAFEIAHHVLALGAHTSDRLMLSRLVGAGINHLAVHFLAEHLPGAPERMLRNLDVRLRSTPNGHSAFECAEFERQFIVGWLRERAGDANVSESLAMAMRDQPACRAMWDDPARRAAAIDALDATFAKANELLRSTPEEWPDANRQIHALHDAGGPLARVFLPSLPGLRMHLDAEAARLAMLRTAVAIVLDGEVAVDESDDPFGDGPFTYRETGGGFELSSALVAHRGERVTLRVGR